MRTLEQQLTQYAAYHRDRRNIATHFIGVPIIVFSVVLALAQIHLGSVLASWIGIAAASVYYLVLDRPLGFAMLAFLFVCGFVTSLITMRVSPMTGLGLAIGLFVFGWIVQFIGHKFEGMKPAFTDDIMGLVIGPLFVMSEVVFMLGLRPMLKKYIEDRVGPTMAARNGKPIGPVGAASSAT